MQRKVLILLFAGTLLLWFLSHVNFLMDTAPRPSPGRSDRGEPSFATDQTIDDLTDAHSDDDATQPRKGNTPLRKTPVSRLDTVDVDSEAEASDNDDSAATKKTSTSTQTTSTSSSDDDDASASDEELDDMDTKPFPHPNAVPQTTAGMRYYRKKGGIRVGRTYKDTGDKELQEKMFARYKRIHNEITSGKRPPRYAVARPNAGFGNRVMGMMGVFLFALVTDRALIADFAYSGSMVPLNDVFEDTGMKLSATPTGSQKAYSHKNSPMDKSPSSIPLDDLLCKDYNQAFTEDVIAFSTNNYMGTAIQRNPVYREKLRKVFGDDPFGPMARFLMKPSARVKKIVEDFIKDQFSSAKYIIGLQMRMDIHNEGGADAFEKSRAWERVFFNCAGDIEKEDKYPAKDTKYFIAADNEGTRKRAVEALGRDKVIFVEDAFKSRTGHADRHVYGWVDMLLLAECDDMITSNWSTFGYVAVAYNSMLSKVVTEVNDTPFQWPTPEQKGALYENIPLFSFERTTCVRQWNSQPCYHFLLDWRAHAAQCFVDDENNKKELIKEARRHC